MANAAIERVVRGTNFGNHSFSSPEEIKQSALNMMNEIFEDPEYKQDPHQYLAKWIAFRSKTEDYRVPEDKLLKIFRYVLNLPPSEYLSNQPLEPPSGNSRCFIL